MGGKTPPPKKKKQQLYKISKARMREAANEDYRGAVMFGFLAAITILIVIVFGLWIIWTVLKYATGGMLW